MASIQGNHRRILISLLCASIFIQIFYPGAHAYANAKHRVLFISSYTESFATVPDQITGIQSVLKAKDIALDIEYMDTKRFDNQENHTLFFNGLKYKLENLPPYDAIIVGDDNALQFAMDHQEELFPQIPIVFLGINDKERAIKASRNPYMTGSVEETSLIENIEIAYRFQPNAKKVVAIVDGTLTGKGDLNQFLAADAYFKDLEFDYLDVSMYSYEEFGAQLENITDDSILFYLSMSQDKTGKTIGLDREFALIKEHTKVPVYRASIGGVGDGLLGGKMISYVELGEISAQMVVDILNGTDISSIPLREDTPYYYLFDYDLIKKYNIDEDLIPDGATLLNKKENVFEKYRNAIMITGSLSAFFLFLTITLIIDNLKRRAIQKKLRENNEELAAIYEELTASEEELRLQNELIQKHAQEVSILHSKYQNAIQSTDSAVWEVDLSSKQVRISENLSQILQSEVPHEGEFYQLANIIIAPEYRKTLLNEATRYLNGNKTEINIEILANTSNYPKWILIRGSGIKDGDDKVGMLHGILLDITKRKEQELYIEYHARHDYLTHLPNRMTFMEQLGEQLKFDNAGAVFLLDIDNFKSINDTLGHLYGDELIKQIAERLLSIADDNMMVARLGGDEFLILISNTIAKDDIDQYAQKVKNAFEEAFIVNGRENYVNCSMGITCYPMDSNNINQLIMNADTAMYQVKHGEKNNYIYYNHDMKQDISKKREIEEILRRAIKQDGFELLYQPQVDTVTGDIVGFEALVRLQNYAVRPDVFIGVAEEAGLIVELGRWVTKTAIEQIVAWRNHGLTGKVVAINFSSKQLRDPDYIPYLESLLEQYEVSPKCLEIEITESVLLEKNQLTLSYLHQLKGLGVRLALDDFGTGYSSINYLTYLPVDKIKLDKSINDKFLNLDDNKVIASIISLAHSLNLSITAEGIEDWIKYEKLKDAGCDFIQGYLFSKPITADEIEALYHKNMFYTRIK